MEDNRIGSEVSESTKRALTDDDELAALDTSVYVINCPMQSHLNLSYM